MKKNRWIFIVYLIGIVLATLAAYRMEPDYLWHIKAGEYMLKNGPLTKDIFSWYVSGQYWMSHEWLFEVVICGLKNIFGNLHIFVYCFSCILILIFGIYFFNKEQIHNNVLFSIFWFINFLLLSSTVQARPHLISYCLLSITVYFLYDLYKNENSKKIYFLPLISIIWANAHGGSSNIPYILCLIFIFAGLFKFSFSKIEAKRYSKKQFIKYLVVMFLCMGAVFINIHGYKMFLYPYQNMLNSVMLKSIMEWQPTNLNTISHYVYFVILLIIIGVLLISKKKIQFTDFILFGFCVYLGLKSIRFWFYTYIIMSYVVFNYSGKRKMDPGTDIGILIVAIILPIMFLVRDHRIFNPQFKYELEREDIEKVKEVKPERLYNLYNYGGELIYNDIKVFIDGRADLYSEHNYEDYLAISHLEKDYVSLINKYDFDYFLVENGYSINTFLKYSEDYELIYSRDSVKLYKKINN